MYSLTNKPYNTLGIIIPIILCLILLCVEKVLDLQLHDTYFVTDFPSVGLSFI